MKTLPTPARVYVGGVIALGVVMLVLYFPLQTFSNPGRFALFGLLLFLSAITSIFKVNLPLTRSGSTMSVSYAVDFASLLLLGPNETMLVAAASAYSQCTFRIKERNPLHRTLFSMACLVITVQAAGAAYHLLGGIAGPVRPRDACPSRSSAQPRPTSSSTRWRSPPPSRSPPTRPIFKVWNENFLWSAPSYFVGAGASAGRDLDGHRLVGALDYAAGRRAAVSDLPHLQGLPRADRRRAAPRARDGRPASRDDRSARPRHRRQGPDVAVAHPARAALCRLGRQSARHVGQRCAGRENGCAPARHREARRAGAHPLEARAVDARGVPEDSRPSEGRRRHRQLGSVPLPGRAAHPEPSRALGRQGLSDGTQGRGHSARRAHPLGRRLFRRADGGAALSQGDELRRRCRLAAAGSWQGPGPLGRREVRPAAAVAARGSGTARAGDAESADRRLRARHWPAGDRALARKRPRRTCSRTSRSRTARFTRSTRSRKRWARASAYRTRWRSSPRS